MRRAGDPPRHSFPGLVEQQARPATFPVQPYRVSPAVVERRQQRLARCRRHRLCRSGVEIRHSPTLRRPARAIWRGSRATRGKGVVLFCTTACRTGSGQAREAGTRPLERQSVSPIRTTPRQGGSAGRLRRWAPRAAMLLGLAIVTTGCQSNAFTRGGQPVTEAGEMWRPGLPVTQLPLLVIPTGETVQFNLTSVDVVHAFWIVPFEFKRDVIPGYANRFTVTPTRTGTFIGRCSELCGVFHSRMLFRVRIVTPAQFRQWIHARQAQQVASGGAQ